MLQCVTPLLYYSGRTNENHVAVTWVTTAVHYRPRHLQRVSRPRPRPHPRLRPHGPPCPRVDLPYHHLDRWDHELGLWTGSLQGLERSDRASEEDCNRSRRVGWTPGRS